MDLYGLIGYPLKHSFSIGYFNQKFEAEKIDARYINYELPNLNHFRRIVEEAPRLRGLNVTTPYKEEVISQLDALDKDAARIGAVNVIKIERTPGKMARLTGYNSDMEGFTRSLEPMLTEPVEKALILGTGGAAKAVFWGLRSLGIEARFVSRTKRDEQTVTYDNLTREDVEAARLIVNATPVGMYPRVNAAPPFPYQYLGERHMLYDLLYNPDITLFMKEGMARGASVKNGLEMLLLQAFISWEIWHR